MAKLQSFNEIDLDRRFRVAYNTAKNTAMAQGRRQQLESERVNAIINERRKWPEFKARKDVTIRAYYKAKVK